MKILIAENNDTFRKKVCDYVKHMDASIEITESNNLHNVFSLTGRNNNFDFLLLSFEMLGSEWRQRLKNILANAKSSKIVFIADNEDKDIINYILEAGCYGYIPKRYEAPIFTSALQLMINDCLYIPPAFLKKGRIATNPLECRLPDGKILTNRQVEVLGHLGKGLSNKQIAYEMSVSEATVKLHINALLKNLGADNRTQAVVSAQRFGFL
ncbi:MAG: response regulator transcription factor [Alphaproteobacteria bacterium]|nr:response regulator transcription factor [Alphaproteobacteria bacterium]